MADQPFLFLPYVGKLRESFKKLDKALQDQNKNEIESFQKDKKPLTEIIIFW